MAETAPDPQVPADEPKYLLRKLVFVVWAVAFVPLFAALRSHLAATPLPRILIGTGVFCAVAVPALWFLGREKHPTLRAWRIVFLARLLLLTPLLLTVVDGVAQQGWPRGRHNQFIVKLLLMVLTMTGSAYLTGIAALLRTYRVASVFALASGLCSVVCGALLLKSSWRFSLFDQRLSSTLAIIGFGTKLESYLSPLFGIALIVGAIMTWRAVRARRAALRTTA